MNPEFEGEPRILQVGKFWLVLGRGEFFKATSESEARIAFDELFPDIKRSREVDERVRKKWESYNAVKKYIGGKTLESLPRIFTTNQFKARFKTLEFEEGTWDATTPHHGWRSGGHHFCQWSDRVARFLLKNGCKRIKPGLWEKKEE